MAQASATDPRDVAGRRRLHFDTVDAALADVDGLAVVQQQAKLRTLGNWTFGQILGHLSAWVDVSYGDKPLNIPAMPWMARVILPLMKNRILNKPMTPGRHIPRVSGGTVYADPMPIEQGLSEFHRTFNRLRVEAPTRNNPMLGPLTHEEWIKLHLRHAELHLSFLVPAE